ncbi:hypothetical protein [Shewanella cyperi]|uniref:hypothetical protein n=1 Tax=Shewanella cyperi TaxID=2814292 RepID=UPI001A94B73A|nr:hypothetical protein [Shewanella cyperi]QSX40074.1 hypothetical protein JYB84_13985 [Shewanella cyperi]
MAATDRKVRSALRAHWFIPAAIAVATADISAVSLDNWSNPALLEVCLILDLSVVMPALYLWCYRTRGKAAMLRALSLSCLGMWVSGHVVPSEYHHILSSVGFVRYIGLAVLLAIELKLALVIYRSVFSKDQDDAPAALTAAKDAGMPDWAARLIAWEASLWRKAWDVARRIVGRS